MVAAGTRGVGSICERLHSCKGGKAGQQGKSRVGTCNSHKRRLCMQPCVQRDGTVSMTFVICTHLLAPLAGPLPSQPPVRQLSCAVPLRPAAPAGLAAAAATAAAAAAVTAAAAAGALEQHGERRVVCLREVPLPLTAPQRLLVRGGTPGRAHAAGQRKGGTVGTGVSLEDCRSARWTS